MREYLKSKHSASTKMHFKHWSRKSYAIFNSLGKTIKISGLTMAVAALLPVNVDAQQNDTTKTETGQEIDLDEVLVEGQKNADVYAEHSRVVTQISKDEIERANVESIQDVLNYVAGIDLRQRGPNDIQADINIRGGTFDQTLILLNGIPINDPQTGHHNLNLPIEINQIERIEILSGPASKIYGPNAFSGAINFITSDYPKKNSIKLNAFYGQHNLYNTGVSLSNTKQGFNNYFSANLSSSDGYIDNTDFKKQNLFYQGSFKRKNTKLLWQSGFTNRAFGANSFYTPKFPDQFEQTRNFINSISYNQLFEKSVFKILVYNRLNTDRFELFREGSEIPSWYSNHNYHKTSVSGVNTTYSVFSNMGKTQFGFDYRNEAIYSNVLGKPMNDTMPALFDENGFYTNTAKRNHYSAFVNHNFDFKRLFLNIGLMANYFSELKVFPGLDISYSLVSKTKVFASINTAMRNPTFTDLYYQGPTNIGNDNLIAETSLMYEIGAKYKSKKIKSYLSLYYNEAKNVIDWVRKADSIKWQPMNYTEIINKGIDFGFTYLPDNFIHFIKFSYLYNTVNKEENEYISFYVLDNLKHKASLNISHKIYKNFGISYSVNYQDRNGSYTKFDSETGNSYQKEYEAFLLIDLGLYYKAEKFKIYAKASNLFDKDYIDIANVPQAGRWLSFGANYKIDY